jgi:hypothetical protein
MEIQSTLSGESTVAPAPLVPQRSTRRATARRASSRRATARQHKDDIDGRIVDYVKHHSQSTTGDMAKGLNADGDTIAAGPRDAEGGGRGSTLARMSSMGRSAAMSCPGTCEPTRADALRCASPQT